MLCAATIGARADVVEMQNGDRYNGKVLNTTTNYVALQSEILGAITLPRDKVSQITFGAGGGSNTVRAVRAMPQARANLRTPPTTARTNGAPDWAITLREMRSQMDVVQQVRSQLLADAPPEVNRKFDEMLSGVLSGRISLNDLRAQAQSAADQMRAMKKELGPEADDALDGYLSILDHFLRDSALSSAPTPSPAQKSPLKSLLDDEN